MELIPSFWNGRQNQGCPRVSPDKVDVGVGLLHAPVEGVLARRLLEFRLPQEPLDFRRRQGLNLALQVQLVPLLPRGRLAEKRRLDPAGNPREENGGKVTLHCTENNFVTSTKPAECRQFPQSTLEQR